ncbi:MAG: GNAT family N-acetyltransferase [Flavobacteriia bacterium]
MFRSKQVHVRSVEPSDATKLMLWENNPAHWKVTDTEVPFSLQGILQLIEQQQHIRSNGQLRLMICLNETNEAIGAIDLYDVDFKNGNAAVGILIGEELHRSNGYAFEALELLIGYARDLLALHNLHCSIQSDNLESIRLFEKCGFTRIGIRKEWFLYQGQRIDEICYQLCLEKK